MKLTKQQRQLAQNYFSARKYGLREVSNVYQKPSYAKMYAENQIFNEMHKFNSQENGFRACEYTVVGYNCMMFSSAYLIRNDVTQLVVALVYHTAYSRYIIIYDEAVKPFIKGC